MPKPRKRMFSRFSTRNLSGASVDSITIVKQRNGARVKHFVIKRTHEHVSLATIKE